MDLCSKEYELVVVGGGLSGVCAAISAARHGVKTALVQDRPVLGGNASSEVRVDVNGAEPQNGRKEVKETGIVLELLLECRSKNPDNTFTAFDNVLWEKTRFQENLDLYLNTYVNDIEMNNNKIVKVIAYQTTTQKKFEFKSKLFVDTTGDAAIAELSGADYTVGREAKSTYNEEHAPEVANSYTMGSTIMFQSKELDHPVKFEKPEWAYKFTRKDLKDRRIRGIKNGYWWIEVGGFDLDVIKDAEEIRDELIKTVYGIWDYIKNSGDFEADNYVLDWVGSVPGKRESRRILGDYVLKEQDVYNGTKFSNGVAYGGWTMDNHSLGGIFAKGIKNDVGTIWHPIKDIYSIPYTCLYSRNIENLFVGGRCISASHMAMSSTRVMATCATIGQAIGTAASIAISKGLNPRQINENITELQKMLIRDDCYIPGIDLKDDEDICQSGCEVKASSYKDSNKPELILNGISREKENSWISQPISKDGEWLEINFKDKVSIKEVQIKFDANLSQSIQPTINDQSRRERKPGMPTELVKDYRVEFIYKDNVVNTICVNNNNQRFQKLELDNEVICNKVKITVLSTYGDESARIFEVKIY